MTSRRIRRIACAAVLVWMWMAGLASADSVRVVRDKSTVWRSDAPSVAMTVVPAGTILEVVGTQGVWLRVRLPRSLGDPNTIGVILASAVEPIKGTSQIPPAKPGQPAGRSPTARARGPRPQIRAFGEVGYLQLASSKSFRAIFDKDSTWIPGAGGQVNWANGLFASADVERFKLTGERAFVNNGQVFRLGIEDVVTVIPVSARVGYQFLRRSPARPYVGAGIGVHIFRERAAFAQAGDDVAENLRSFHLVGGVEFLVRRHFSSAIEAQYTTVSDAIGTGGVSQVFNENELGGFTIKVKLLVH